MTDQEFRQIVAMFVKWTSSILAAGGGGAVVAYGLFRYFGKNWLDQHSRRNSRN